MTYAFLWTMVFSLAVPVAIALGCGKAVRRFFGNGFGWFVILFVGGLVGGIVFIGLHNSIKLTIANYRNTYPEGMMIEEVITYDDPDDFYAVTARKEARKIDGYVVDYDDTDGDTIIDIIEEDEGGDITKKTIFRYQKDGKVQSDPTYRGNKEVLPTPRLLKDFTGT
ncbi:hypothetical protein ACFL0Z_03490 [Patescibacteria group bacterium]